MCGNLDTPSSSEETKTMDCLTGAVGNNCSFSVLLEFAADNDVEASQRYMIASDVSLVGEVGLWYGCRKSSKQMVVEQRTPLMIAARYGSVDVVKLILSLSETDVNLSCGPDKSTALHCAASGGSIRAVEVVKLLLLAAADPYVTDAYGYRPFDVIVAPWNMPQIKVALEELLNNHDPVCLEKLHDSGSSSLVSDVKITAVTCKTTDNIVSSAQEKEYPVDPSFLILIAVFTALMSFVCSRLRSGFVPELIPMIGLSVLLCTQVKMLEEETQESFITVVHHVLIFVRGAVSREIYVNMLMVFLNPGCTLPSTELESARMAQLANVASASLPINLRNCDHFIYPLD